MNDAALVLCADLLFSSNLHNAVRQVGLQSRTALTGDQALILLAQQPFRWVIVDLEMPGVDLAALHHATQQHSGCQVIAFGPHVHEGLFKQARQAGITNILTRGQTASGLASILRTTLE